MLHLRKDEIRDFLAGRLDTTGRRRVLAHLYGGCARCRCRIQTLSAPLLLTEPWTAADAVPEDQYEEALTRLEGTARALMHRWRKESEKLQRALSLLDQSPAGLGDERFPWSQARALHGWPLCEALLRKSWEARFGDPQRMLKLAESAANMAKHIKQETYPWPGTLRDLRVRALAELGNAYRVNDRFSEADAAFDQAWRIIEEEGTEDPLLYAHLLDLWASLRRAQRRLAEAIALLDRVHELYLEAGEPHRAGRALISVAINTHYLGSPREAVTIFEQGLAHLEPKREPQLVAIAQQARLHALTECGEFGQASRLLLESGLREAFAKEPLNLLKLRWVEGKIHAGLGRQARAERAFTEVRHEYHRLGQVYDAALVGLELAAIWLKQGKADQVLELAEEMYETLEDLAVQREAARALHFIREACRLQAVNAPMIERVRKFLERLPWQPGLRFEPALFAP
jgi:tetratricopeptide (TPR) repeat protein